MGRPEWSVGVSVGWGGPTRRSRFRTEATVSQDNAAATSHSSDLLVTASGAGGSSLGRGGRGEHEESEAGIIEAGFNSAGCFNDSRSNRVAPAARKRRLKNRTIGSGSEERRLLRLRTKKIVLSSSEDCTAVPQCCGSPITCTGPLKSCYCSLLRYRLC